MHARAAVKFVQIANKFRSEVKVIKDGTGGQRQEHHGPADAGGGAAGSTMSVVAVGTTPSRRWPRWPSWWDRGFGEGVADA